MSNDGMEWNGMGSQSNTQRYHLAYILIYFWGGEKINKRKHFGVGETFAGILLWFDRTRTCAFASLAIHLRYLVYWLV